MPRKSSEIPDLTRLPMGRTQPMALYLAAAGFSVLWLVGVGLYLWSGLSPAGVVGQAMTGLVVVLPLGLAWFSVSTLTAIRALRDEARHLQGTVDKMRVTYASTKMQVQVAVALRPAGQPEPGSQNGAKQNGAPQNGAKQNGAPISFASRRDYSLTVPSADRKAVHLAPRPTALTEDQPGLALGTPNDDAAAPLAMADFVRAIHFPESPDDAESFRALRVALADRTTAKLIRAAQDVLTLLAQEGIYMDDLSPDRARPELWRKFAGGERGRAVAGLGGIRDRSCLALTALRMREDAVFRDAAHHFLRSFDKALAAVEPKATDTELSTLSDTRTARAFMLFGRVTGTFD